MAAPGPGAGAAGPAVPEWTPDPALMKAAIDQLRSVRTSTNAERAAVTATLVESGKSGQFNQYLVYMLSRGVGQLETPIRQLAGLLLKGNVDKHLATWPAAIRMHIQAEVVRAIGDADRHVRRTVANVITSIVSQVRLTGWPYILQVLAGLLRVGVSEDAIDGALACCVVLCEDWTSDLNSEALGWPLNTLIPAFILFFKHPNGAFRFQAAQCMLHFVYEGPTALHTNMADYMAGLSALTLDKDPRVRKIVCESITALTETHMDYLLPNLREVFAFFLRSMTDGDETVQLAACTFWNVFMEFGYEHLSVLHAHLPVLVPLLLADMQYSEEELADLPAEDIADAAVADKASDVAPHMYTSHAHGMDDEDDSDEDDDGLGGSMATLRKVAGHTLQTLASTLGEPVVTLLLPELNKRFTMQGDQDGVWEVREAGIMAFGAVVATTMEIFEPCLPQLFPIVLGLVEDKRPLIRSISCWVLGRIASWVVAQSDQASYSHKALGTLCAHMLDHNKKVQASACSGFATLVEHAGASLQQFVVPILDTMTRCFATYQAQNQNVLYDAVGAFCDSMGPEVLGNPTAANKLLTPMYARWNAVKDDDPALCPLLECMASVARGLGKAFVPSAEPVYMRAVRLLETNLIAIKAAEDAGESLGGGGELLRDFLVLSLDLVSGLSEGLGPVIDGLFAKKDILVLVRECMQDSNESVRQSGCAVIGDMALTAVQRIAPGLKEVLGTLVMNLDEEVPYVCNNASWAIGEVAARLPEQTRPYAPFIMGKLIPLVNNGRIDAQLQANVSICIGRLAAACPAEVAPLASEFAANWLRTMRNIIGHEDKMNTFVGLGEVLKLNSKAIAPHFIALCEAIQAWQRPPPQMVAQFKQIIAAFKSSFGAQQWGAVIATMARSHADLGNFMTMHYGM